MMLAFAYHRGFVVNQIDLKSAFFNMNLKEEVYVKETMGFEDPKYVNHVFMIHKKLIIWLEASSNSMVW